MIIEAGFAIVIFWSWPGDGPKNAAETFTLETLYATARECEQAVARDFQQFKVELQQDLGYPGHGSATCKLVFEFDRVEMK